MSERRKPDFGNVRAGVSTSAAKKPSATKGPKQSGPDFSNVTAGVRSTARGATPGTYTVKKGDSLSKIAKAVYANANQWKRIYEANKDQIADADLIHPGQVLRIPELPR